MRSGHITGGFLHLLSQLPVAWLQNLHIQRIEETLRSISTNRSKAMTKKKDKSSNQFIKVVHANELFEFAGLRSVLHIPHLNKLLRLVPGEFLQVCDKLASPVSRYLYNVSAVSRAIRFDESLLPRCTDLIDGHVATADYTVIDD